MKDWIDGRLAPRLGACVESAGRHPLVVVTVTLLLTAGALFLVATRLGINSETEAMLSEELAYRQHEF